MKRSTLVRHLKRLAEVAGEDAQAEYGPRPLVSLWITGEALDAEASTIDHSAIVIVVDVPSQGLSWRARPSIADYLTVRLSLTKTPIWAVYRPRDWPAWNAEHRSVAKFWSIDGGLDEAVIAGIRDGGDQPVVTPGDAEFRAQMETEVVASRRHLDDVVARFYDNRWRANHKGFGLYPGDHLWWAAAGLRDIEKALAPPDAEAGPAAILQAKVTLRGVEPPIWRRVVVPSNMPLHEFAWALIRAMGWNGSHLHMYDVAGTKYGSISPDWESLGELDEESFRIDDVLPAVGSELRFDYDFGDGWEHDVVVEAIEPVDPAATYPSCVDGARACPPDDVGGPHGYQEMLDVLADPRLEDPNQVRAWARDGWAADRFDVAEAGTAMQEPLPRSLGGTAP